MWSAKTWFIGLIVVLILTFLLIWTIRPAFISEYYDKAGKKLSKTESIKKTFTGDSYYMDDKQNIRNVDSRLYWALHGVNIFFIGFSGLAWMFAGSY